MAAKPKLTPEQWNKVRETWESDRRKSLAWLVSELNLPVSNEAVRVKAKNEGWKKSKNPSLGNEKNKLDERQEMHATETKITDKKPVKKSVSITADKVAEPDKGGRPTKYREEYSEQAYRLCLLGATDAEMAEFFRVDEATINKWKIAQHSFYESIRRGKMESDAKLTERLYVRACGYRYSEIKVRSAYGENGEKVPVEEIETEKEVPPDGPSAFRWLYNRRPQNWRERNESSLEIKFDKETLEEIKQTFIKRMDAARERQREVLIERGILIENGEE